MSNCPYCSGSQQTIVTTTRKRHPMHTTVVCGQCNDYYLVHRNGRSYPLIDRADQESDPILQVR